MLDPDAIRRQLLVIFRQEQAEHSEAVRLLLAATVSDDGAGLRPLSPEERDEVFRRFHSLKGAARAVDLTDVEQLAHRAEAVLGRIRAGELTVSPDALSFALACALEAMEAMVVAADDPTEQSAADRTAAEAVSLLDALSTGDASPAPITGPTEVLPQEEAEPVLAPPAPGPPAVTSVPVGDDTVRVRARHLDRISAEATHLQRILEEQAVAANDLRVLEAQLAQISALLGSTGDAPVAANTTLSQTLGAARSRLRTLRQTQQDREWRLNRVALRLQDESRAARLVAAETALEGLDRMLEAVARDSGKAATLRVVGGEVLIDRQVAHALRDPLRHLLRNTVSHGLESPSEREKAGKPRAGAVEVRFRVRGTLLEVDVDDDGRGLNVPSILQNAVASGLLSADDAARTGAEDAGRLIFQAGFSTAQVADRLSGRGMGLSVVARAATRLGGDVRALPRPGGGTRFRLTVPLSLATTRLLLVDVGEQTFGLPTFVVEGLHRLPADRMERIEDRTLVRVEKNGEPVPVADLATLLDLPPSPPPKGGEGRVFLVIARLQGVRWALRVDRFRAETEAVIRPLGPYLASVRRFGGSVVLSDGTVALSLLPGELTARSYRSATPLPLSEAGEARAARPDKRTRTILVADDSITTRSLERSILEAHGYHVRVAVDGRDALQQLREAIALPGQGIDLVVSDLEMPHLNGFELVEAVKADARLSQTPIVLVTSREAFADRERGLSLGADAYIVKQRFDQQELLEVIEQLLV